MTLIPPSQLKPSTTNGDVMTTVAGAAAWASSSSVGPTTEQIQDIVGALLAAGTGITVTYNDAGNVETIAIDTAAETERVQDIIGAMTAAGTGITVAYNDAAGTLTLSATG